MAIYSKIIGKKVYRYEKVSSTNDIASKLSKEGEGIVVIANTQTKGRGKLGRTWFSPKDKNIYVSIILQPKINSKYSPRITLICALSIVQTLNEIFNLDTKIKWPNDIFINNKKLGGILTEINTTRDIINYAIVGIGLNLNMEKEDFPEDLREISISLKQILGYLVSKDFVLEKILQKIETNYLIFQKDGFMPLLQKIKLYIYNLNNFIKINFNKQIIEGQIIDLDDNGSLLLRTSNGFIKPIISGEIICC